MTIGVNQKSSPIKFCFLIKPNSNTKFERAVKMAFSLWGGIYSPILPLYKNMPKAFRQEYDISLKTKLFYKNSINNYDPDIVLYDDELDENYIKELIGKREIIKIEDFQIDLNKGENEYGINSLQITSSVIESEFKFKRNDDLKLLLPNTQKSSLFIKSFFGATLNKLNEVIDNNLKDKSFYSNPELTLDNCSDYYPNNNLTFLELNLYHINYRPERHWYRGVSIYFIDESRLNDLSNFWNLRALGWNIIPVPLNNIDNNYFNNLLERFVQFQIEHNNGITFLNYLISSTTSVAQKKTIDEKLSALNTKLKEDVKFSFQGWFPRFWEERSVLEADKTLCEKAHIDYKYSQVEIKDNYVKFKVESLPFKINFYHNSRSSYKVNLSFTYFDEFANDAGLIYGIDSIDWVRLTHSFGRDKWRLSKSGLSYFVKKKDDEVHFSIPKAKDFFKVYFSKRDSILKETANGQLANEVLSNIGGIRGSYFLKNKSALNILDLFEDGKVITYPHLLGEIKKNLKIKKNPEAEFYLKRLIENKIIEFGAKIQCSICNQRTFYLLNELNEKMTCSVCRNSYDLPLHTPKIIDWSYRGIGPFSKNNKVGGLMSVFLTLKLFKEEFADTSGNMSSLIGFELEKKSVGLKEVDLAVLLQERNEDTIPPDLFLCECKTFKNFTSKDIERMIELGEEFPNAILTFATLKDELYEEEKNEIKKVVSHFRKGVGNRPTNPVLILTSKELMPEDFFGHFREYKKNASTYQKYNDWIGNLCELTVEKHLDLETWGKIRSDLWVAEMEKRNKKNAPQHSV
jgi:hypothetical protein